MKDELKEKSYELYSAFFIGLLFLMLIVVLFPVLRTDAITAYDDQLLLEGVAKIHGIKAYFEGVLGGRILDLQPVRDLSYLWDFKLKSLFSFHSFHLTNLLIWFFTCLLLRRILKTLSSDCRKDFWAIWALIFFYAFSPVAFSSVAWIAARKHLLSTFFILGATTLFLEGRKGAYHWTRLGAILALYILSLFSQPINLLWPLFAFFIGFKDQRLKELKFLWIFLFSILLIVAFLNLYYYQTIYVTLSGGDGKYDEQYGLGLSLLALGRYFYLSLFPFDALPVSHYQGSWENMLGLVLLVGFYFLVWKKRKEHFFLLPLGLYFFLPLFPVTYKITRIFCSDTYLLNASLGVSLSLFLLLKKFRAYPWGIGIYSLFLLAVSFYYAAIFQKAPKIWEYAYKREPTPHSVVNLAAHTLYIKNYPTAEILIKELEILEPENRFLVKLRSELIYEDSRLNLQERIKKLEALPVKHPVSYYLLAQLYSKQNDKKKVEENVQGFFSNPPNHIKYSYLQNERVMAQLRWLCEKHDIEESCLKAYRSFNEKVVFRSWDAELYSKIYSSLKNQ